MGRYLTLGSTFRKIAALWISCLMGCVTTELASGKTAPEVTRLASLSARKLEVAVEEVEDPHPLGSQFMLLVIPFGRIVLPDPERRVATAIERSLAIRGTRALLVDAPGPGSLAVSIEALEISAYDLLVTRRLSGRVRLSGTLIGRDGHPRRHYTSEASESSFRRYGFEPQLEEVLSGALHQAVEELLRELRL